MTDNKKGERKMGIKSICSTMLVCSASAACLMFTEISRADTWTGGGLDDNWTNGANWLDGSAPTLADSVFFDINDSGNTNGVNEIFQILELSYGGGGTHITNNK